MNTEYIMPYSRENVQIKMFTIDHLFNRYRNFLEKEPYCSEEHFPWAKGFVMGYPLPQFQREVVWTDEMNANFIRSIWLRLDIGSYLVNTGVFDKKFSDALLDGQQRLTAIEKYITDKFPVAGESGELIFWSSLPLQEQRRFRNTIFTQAISSEEDESKLRQMYNVRAFGGVRHNPEDKA